MATFTITTPVNIDTLASKAGSDTYNINGGYLTVDQDTRYGTNSNTSAGMGNITLSATLGGTIEFNATAVRLIPYDTGSGTVPASNTVITNNGASGKLIAVYSALNAAPTAAGAAMPASGYIKVKQVTGTYAAGTLTGTGLTATATGPDTPGWIEIVGVDALTCTVNRLNLFKVRGDWYYFEGATTSGSSATTYQIPSNGANVYAPGVWVETGVGTDVYEFYPCAGTIPAHVDSIATDAIRGKVCWISTAGLVTFQTDGTTNNTGGYLPPAGCKIRVPNILFSTCTAGALTVNALPNATLATRYDFTTTGGGAIDIDKAMMNWYPSFAQPYSVALSNFAVMTQLSVSEIAAPIAWSHVGVGQEAANSQFGLVMSTCLAGGTMSDCVRTRTALPASAAYCASMADMSGFTFTNIRYKALGSRGHSNTGTMTLTRVNDSTWISPLLGGGRAAISTCARLTFNDTIYYDHPAWTTNYTAGTSYPATAWTRSAATATVTKANHGLRVNDRIAVTVSSDISAITVASKTITAVPTVDTFTFTSNNAGSTSGTLTYNRTATQFAVNLFDIASSCNDITFDGLSFGGLTMVQPYASLLNVGAAGCNDIKLRNIGTWDSQLELGAARHDDVAWSRTTTTATVTKVAHGLKVGDTVYAIISSSVAAITVGAKVVSAVPTADTFSFVCLNAGAASGTLSYYPAVTANIYTIAAAAVATNIKIQRVYTDHTRTGIGTVDNSSKNILVESVFGDPVDTFIIPTVNAIYKGIGATQALTPQVSCYGTTWIDAYNYHLPTDTVTVAWTRSATTATVTSTNHRLRTGALVVVSGSSDTAAILNGQKTITVTNSNEFTFTCFNLGATSGTLTFEVLSGRVSIQMNESTVETANYYTIDSGTPLFTSTGLLYMPTIGQQITFTSPEYIIGHTNFPISEAVMTNGTITNHDITYAIDKNDGNGFGSFHNLAYARAGGSGSPGASTFTVTSATGVEIGDYVFGTNVGPLAKVTNVVSNTITVDVPNVGTVSGVIRFNHLPGETGINAELGFKLKVRILTTTTNVAAMSSLSVYTNSTPTSRTYTYPLDTATLILTGLVSGSDVVILQPGTSTEYINVDSNAGTTFTYVYDSDVVTSVDVAVYKAGYVPFFVRNFTVTSAGASLPIAQVADRAYA